MRLNLGPLAFSFSRTTWWVRGRFGIYLLKFPWAVETYGELYGGWLLFRFAGFRILWHD